MLSIPATDSWRRIPVAEICADHGIIFIGPKPATIDMMGDKATARRTALPGFHQPGMTSFDVEKGLAEAKNRVPRDHQGHGWRRRVRVRKTRTNSADPTRLRRTKPEAFGNQVYVENSSLNRTTSRSGDGGCPWQCRPSRRTGLFHQRRHQKLIEESPSPDDVRAAQEDG